MTTIPAITIIETPDNTAQSLACLLEAGQIECTCMSPEDCLSALDNGPAAPLILIDLLPNSSALFGFLNQVLYRSLCPPVLLLTGQDKTLRLSDQFPLDNVMLLPGSIPPKAIIETVKHLLAPHMMAEMV